jgi:HK97 family phage portal protein
MAWQRNNVPPGNRRWRLRDRIRAFLQPEQQKVNPAYQGLIAYDERPQPLISPRTYRTFAIEGYRGNDTVYKAISYIARNGAAIPPKLYRDRTMQEEISDHPLLDLLQQPNPEQSGVQYREVLLSQKLIAGNAYQLALRAGGPQDTKGIPKELWLLRPDLVEVIPSSTRGIVGYKYAYLDQPLPAANVAHSRYYHPDNEFYGLSPLEVAALLVDQQKAARLWNLALLQNNARPPGAWIVPTPLGENERRRLEQVLQEKLAGYKNAGKAPVLDAGLTWQPLAHPPEQLDYLDAIRYNAVQIANIFNIPPQLIGDTSASTYDNMKEAKAASYTEAIFPELDDLYALWNAWLVPMFADLQGAYLYYDKEGVEVVQEVIQEKKTAQAQRAVQAFAQGTCTLNEARAMQGLPPLGDNGEIFRVGQSLIRASDLAAYAASQAGSAAVSPSSPSKEPIVMTDNSLEATEEEPGALTQGESEALAHEEAAKLRLLEPGWHRARLVKGVLKLSGTGEEERRAFASAFHQQRAACEQQASLWLQRYFHRELTQVLGHLAQLHPVHQDQHEAVWQAIASGLQEEEEQLLLTLQRIHEQCAQQVGGWILHQLSDAKALAPWWTWSTDILHDLLQRLASRVRWISQTTRQSIQSEVLTGIRQGEGIPEITKRIKQLYLTQIIPNRSRVIARTETIAASNWASQVAARRSGLQLQKVWLATEDERTRPAHAAMNGQRVPLDQPFVIEGHLLDYPGDTSHGAPPELTIQCRCTLYYERADPSILVETEEEDQAKYAPLVLSSSFLEEGQSSWSDPHLSPLAFSFRQFRNHWVRSAGGEEQQHEGMKHLPGRHDQRTHGRRRAIHEIPFRLTPISEQEILDQHKRFAELFDQMNSKESDGTTKQKIMRALAEKLKGDPDVEQLGKEHFYGHPYGATPIEKCVSGLVSTWASTSADANRMALAVQLAAAKEFNLPAPHTEHFPKSALGAAQNILARHEVAIRKVLRLQYEQTQAFFRSNGIKEVILFRGCRFAPGEVPHSLQRAINNDQPDRWVTAGLQPLSSFSFDPTISASFASGSKNRIIMYARVPVRRLLSTCITGYGCKTEAEMVLIGSTDQLLAYGEQGFVQMGSPFTSVSSSAMSRRRWSEVLAQASQEAQAQRRRRRKKQLEVVYINDSSPWEELEEEEEYTPMDLKKTTPPDEVFLADALLDNADWAKRSWDLPEIDSADKLLAWLACNETSLQEFSQLPICRNNRSQIHWLEDLLTQHGL